MRLLSTKERISCSDSPQSRQGLCLWTAEQYCLGPKVKTLMYYGNKLSCKAAKKVERASPLSPHDSMNLTTTVSGERRAGI